MAVRVVNPGYGHYDANAHLDKVDKHVQSYVENDVRDLNFLDLFSGVG